MLPSYTLAVRIVAWSCAVLPGAVAWWSGRRLLARRDDPALPELLLQRRSSIANVAAVAGGSLVAFAHGATLAGAAALFAAALLVGAYPARRALRGETWGLGAYVWNVSRRVAVSTGCFVALAFAPRIVLGAPERWAPWLAAVLAMLLVAWLFWAAPLWLRAYGATPLAAHSAGAAVASRFAEVVARSTVRAPETFRIGRPGERMVGAYALPTAPRAQAVAFGEGLLELLTPDELTAVFAHEVAHLEHATPTRVRRGRIAGAALAVGGAALGLAARSAGPESAWLVTYLWPLAVVIALAARAGRSRAHELASDRRAAELCGDTEALVRALVTLHGALHLPRRWSADFERSATHPSLANRVRALRAAAATSPTAGAVAAVTTADAVAPVPDGPTGRSLGAPVVLRSTQRGTFVVLDAARVSVLAGVPDGVPAGDAAALLERAESVRAESYGRLVELRVSAEAGGARVLVVTDRAGASWRVPLEPADVGVAQATLDVVDVRLAAPHPTTADRAPARAVRALAVVVPLTALTAAMVTGHAWLVLLAALLAVLRPGAAPLALLGATALGGALTALAWDPTTTAVVLSGGVTALAVVALALAGAVSLALAWRQSRADAAARAAGGDDTVRRGARAAVVAPAVAAALLVALAVTVGVVTGRPAAALPLLRDSAVAVTGLAAALTAASAGVAGGAGVAGVADSDHRRQRRRRRGGLAAAAAAALAVALLTFALRDDSGAATAARSLPLGTALAPVEAARVAFDAPGRDLRLSPSATRYAVRLAPTPSDSADGVGAAADGEDGPYDDDEADWEGAAADDASAARYEAIARTAAARARAIAAARYVVGAFDDSAASAPRRTIAATDLAFVDDERVLALSGRGRDSLALTLEPATADGGAPAWEVRLPPLDGARLRYSAADGGGTHTWTVVGRERGTRDVVALSGRVGARAGDVVTRRWSVAAADTGAGAAGAGPSDLYVAGAAVPTPDGGALAVRLDNSRTRWWPLMAMVGVPAFRWEAWRIAASGPPARVLTAGGVLRCVAPHAESVDAAAAVCLAQENGDATVWLVPAAVGGAARAVGRVPGWYGEPVAGPDGGVALPGTDGRSAVLLEPTAAAAGRATLLHWSSERDAGDAAVAAAGMVGRELQWSRGGVAQLRVSRGRRSEVVLYRLR